VDILQQLDLRTLTDFRLVNRRATELVLSLPQYSAITTHALNALRGILSIETGRWVTCSALYEKLTTPCCEQCGDFGGYLYLLTCRRVCFLCLSEAKAYLPLPPKHAKWKFGLDDQAIKTLPRMRVIPGIYSPNERKIAPSVSVLVDYESALHAGCALHGSSAAMHQYVSDRNNRDRRAYFTKMAAARDSGSPTGHIRRPPLGDPFDGRSGNPLRFAAIVPVPWLSRSSHQAEWGFCCLGCKKSSRKPLHWRRRFTKSSFDEHLKECGEIKNGTHVLG
jgi:hypothetical protein